MRIYNIIFAFALFASISIEAKSDEPLRHHIIIAVDKAGCDGWIGNKEVRTCVNTLLNRNLSTTKTAARHYFDKGDYVSLVGFRINAEQCDMNVFAMPLKGGPNTITYQQYNNRQLNRLLTEKWEETVLQPYNSGDNSFSLVSVAKEYALGALKSKGQQVGRTFLVMITDRHYNGNNFYDEMKAFEIKQAEKGLKSRLTPQLIFKRCYEVEQYYYSRYISTDSIWADHSYSPIGYVEFYEYVPLQRNFTLSAAINYPTHLTARRKRNGDYQVEIPISWCNGNQYRFHRMEAFPNYTGNIVYKTPEEASILNTLTDDTLAFDIPSDKSVKCLQLRAWLGLVDGFYNATLMSPDEDSPIELGRNGLNTLIPIEYEEDATILGVPIPGVLWPPFVEDQYTAVLVWKIILWILFIGWLIWMGYRLARPEYYKPRADEFTIGYKE